MTQHLPHRRFPRRALALLAGATLLAACAKQAPPAPPPPEAGFVTVGTQAVTLDTELTGRVAATLQSDVRPQVSGLLQSRLFKEGQYVRKGQPLYQIDPRTYRAARDQAAAQLQSARAAAVTAEAKAKRYQGLRDIQAVSRQDIDDATAAAGEARAAIGQYGAALQSAQVNLGFTTIVAPIGGRIGRSAFTPGALVTSGQTDALATIQQLDPIYVDIVQSATQLLHLRRQLASGDLTKATAAVKLKLEDGTDYPQAGTVEFSEVNVDPNAGTVTIRARFPNPNGVLLPGMFVRVVTPEAVAPQAILVPQQGITRDPKGTATALVLGAGDKVEQREVVTDRAIGNTWLVTSGLKPGDRLIVEGTGKVHPGMAAKPVSLDKQRAR